MGSKEIDRNEVLTVKIYFINPVDIISVVINSLINLEFESYKVSEDQRIKIFPILKENPRNVIFFCIRKKTEIPMWLEYIEKVQAISDVQNLLGAFVYDTMKDDDRSEFLLNNVSLINYRDIQSDTLQVMRNILTFFEAKGKRGYIRTKTVGECKAYFYAQKHSDPIIVTVEDISVFAFTVKVLEMYKYHFSLNTVFDEVVLVLRGVRIKTAAKVIGFSKDGSGIFVLKFLTPKFDGKKMLYIEKNTPENSQKVHDYIKRCINDDLQEKLEHFDDEGNPVEVKKAEVETKTKDKTETKEDNKTGKEE